MKLWLVRHGQTQANIDGLYCGQTDLALTPAGEQQARDVAALLQGVSFDSIISSELRRARDSARLIAGDAHHSPQIDARLNEIHFGAWEMRHHRDIAREDAQRYQAWCRDWQHVAPPQGEGFADFSRRVAALAEELKAESGAQNRLLVSHQGVISLLIACLLDMPCAGLWHFAIDQGAWGLVEIDGGFSVLRTLNSRAPASV
ncbi:adenosylcobalamin/alpha-ribazole phosphatase [Entomohabitans teleogrylli]|uniref:adenosylcobalamin/alpha-ribazole phosphatase n=1 Tax=Entomohabitans teleogrylli TaxID=1384589 RepID=UPI00073DB6AC|nr:adenosylcobalamin/alpha-ribazole phosphatase [Entomohabitans teleogrylli]